MPEMPAEKAFWHATFTVGIAALIVAGFLLYLVGPHAEEWPAFVVVILVPAILLFPLVYHRYQRGPQPQPTPRQHRKSAILFGCVATVYIFATIAEHKTGWRSRLGWVSAAAWLAIALDHLRRARQSKQVAQTNS
jgi:peptidoglycan/LPS O-acetylase OafA/YrhL